MLRLCYVGFEVELHHVETVLLHTDIWREPKAGRWRHRPPVNSTSEKRRCVVSVFEAQEVADHALQLQNKFPRDPEVNLKKVVSRTPFVCSGSLGFGRCLILPYLRAFCFGGVHTIIHLDTATVIWTCKFNYIFTHVGIHVHWLIHAQNRESKDSGCARANKLVLVAHYCSWNNQSNYLEEVNKIQAQQAKNNLSNLSIAETWAKFAVTNLICYALREEN